MQKRYLYILLFGLPGLLLSLILTVLSFGMLSGGLWLFVFGDNPWPVQIQKILPILFALLFIVLWITIIAMGYVYGKRMEHVPGPNVQHIVVSIGFALALVSMIVMHQLRVGNPGAKPETILCADYCSENGYAASGKPPRDSGDAVCSCFDDQGNEAVKVPMARIAPVTSE